MLRLRDVSKSFEETIALRGVDLEVPSGQTVALIGPSGSGKSTLLRLMNGLIRPDTGDLYLENDRVEPWRDLSLRRRMGYVIQEGGLFPHLTARDNVSILARHLRWPRDRIDGRVGELLELTRLEENLLDRYPLELSGGQRQRISLMRALMLDPDYLLLDEPLGALDPMIRSELQRDLRAIFRSLGKTVIVVTHDLFEARYFADRMVLLESGRMVQDGSFDDLVASPVEPFVTRFVNAQREILDDSEGPLS